MITLDVEASGLQDGSYPIQIGFTIEHDKEQSTTEFLIKPAATWTHWDSEAEEFVHFISRQKIENEGIDVHEACDVLNASLADQTVIVDSKDYDLYWLKKLYAEADREMNFNIINIDEYLQKTLGISSDDYEIVRERYEFLHSAGEDSRVILAILKEMSKTNPA